MFSTLPPLSQHPFSTYAPHVSSPLSSSPLRPPPPGLNSSPLSLRDGNSRAYSYCFGQDFTASQGVMEGWRSHGAGTGAGEGDRSPRRAGTFEWDGKGDGLRSDEDGNENATANTNARRSKFSKRTTKKNPLLEGVGEAREVRRSQFLRRVREGAQERRWEARGGDDEMMRTVWVAEQRRREERRAREAEFIPVSQEEDGDVDVNAGLVRNTDEEMADEVAQMEDAEMKALVLMMEAESGSLAYAEGLDGSLETPYGSDDDEYDSLFMDVIQAEEEKSHVVPETVADPEAMLSLDSDMMDIS